MHAIQQFLRSLACVLAVMIRWLPLLAMVEWWSSTSMLGPCHLVWFQRSRHAQSHLKMPVLEVLRVNRNWIQGLTPLTSLKGLFCVWRMLRLATQSAKLFGASRMQKAAVWLLQFSKSQRRMSLFSLPQNAAIWMSRIFFWYFSLYNFAWIFCGKQLHWWWGCWQVLYPFHAKEPSRCCIVWSQVEKMNCYLQVMTTVWRDGTSGHLSMTWSATCSVIASNLISFMYEEYLTIGKVLLLLCFLYIAGTIWVSQVNQLHFCSFVLQTLHHIFLSFPLFWCCLKSAIPKGHFAPQKRCWSEEPAGSTISQLHGTHFLCWGNPASEVLWSGTRCWF